MYVWQPSWRVLLFERANWARLSTCRCSSSANHGSGLLKTFTLRDERVLCTPTSRSELPKGRRRCTSGAEVGEEQVESTTSRSIVHTMYQPASAAAAGRDLQPVQGKRGGVQPYDLPCDSRQVNHTVSELGQSQGGCEFRPILGSTSSSPAPGYGATDPRVHGGSVFGSTASSVCSTPTEALLPAPQQLVPRSGPGAVRDRGHVAVHVPVTEIPESAVFREFAHKLNGVYAILRVSSLWWAGSAFPSLYKLWVYHGSVCLCLCATRTNINWRHACEFHSECTCVPYIWCCHAAPQGLV